MEQLLTSTGGNFVLTLIVVALGSVYGKAILQAISDKVVLMIQKKGNNIVLSEHPMFIWLEKMLKYKLDGMVFHDTNSVRDKITRDFLKIKLGLQAKSWSIFVQQDFKGKSIKQVRDDIFDLISSNSELYKKEAEEKGIPMKFIQKYELIRSKKAELFFEKLDLICRSGVVPTAVETVSSVLVALWDSFEISVMEAELSISQINGELDNEVYFGQRVGPGEKKNRCYPHN